jgi:hypothetical protein
VCAPQRHALPQLDAQLQGVQVLPAVQRRLDCRQRRMGALAGCV